MAHKTLIGGTAYDVTGGRCLVGGTGYAIKKGRTLIGGTGYDVTFGTPIGELPEGTVVKLLENNVLTEFYVAQHGYPTAGNGRTLLVRKYQCDARQWHTTNKNAYATSAIDSWLNSTYFNLLHADIRGQIAAVSIPYTPSDGNNTVGSLSRKVFLLSHTEFGGQPFAETNTEGYALTIGTTLRDAKRMDGTDFSHWTRTPSTRQFSIVVLAKYNGYSSANCTYTRGFLPAFTLPASFTGYEL